MTDDERHVHLLNYVERWGILFEQLGATRMMGKVLGWLLVCDPPNQTAKEIAEAIGASISTVSTVTRSLTQASFIERVGIPGERSAYFRIMPGMWTQLLKTRMRHLSAMSELAQEGLDLLASSNEKMRLRLRETQSYCAFIERELPSFLRRWEEEWKGERA